MRITELNRIRLHHEFHPVKEKDVLKLRHAEQSDRWAVLVTGVRSVEGLRPKVLQTKAIGDGLMTELGQEYTYESSVAFDPVTKRTFFLLTVGLNESGRHFRNLRFRFDPDMAKQFKGASFIFFTAASRGLVERKGFSAIKKGFLQFNLQDVTPEFWSVIDIAAGTAALKPVFDRLLGD